MKSGMEEEVFTIGFRIKCSRLTLINIIIKINEGSIPGLTNDNSSEPNAVGLLEPIQKVGNCIFEIEMANNV